MAGPRWRAEDVGVAFSADDQTKILAQAPLVHSANFQTYIRLLLLTAMRPDKEVLYMQWRHVDFYRAQFEVANSKTAPGIRVLPMNDELTEMLAAHRERHITRWGSVKPDHYLFAMMNEGRNRGDSSPAKRAGSFKKVWGSVKEETGVEGRLHDCRHSVLTRLAESGDTGFRDSLDCGPLVATYAGAVFSHQDEGEAASDGRDTTQRFDGTDPHADGRADPNCTHRRGP